jgi:hypothetical protein
MIPFERPDTIVAAIHEVFAAANARNTAKLSQTGGPPLR